MTAKRKAGRPALGVKYQIAFRISRDMHRALRAATREGPYKLTLTQIVERGIRLAVEELRKERVRK